MLIFTIDNDQIMLEHLVSSIIEAEPNVEVRAFIHSSDAVKAVLDLGMKPHVVFCEMQMPVMDGIKLCTVLKSMLPQLNMVFIASFPQHMEEAFALHASGYLIKPVSQDRIRAEIHDLRYPISEEATRRVFVKTFGNFEVFIDGHPAKFKHDKTKEYLAYLIDRGALCTNGEIAAALWERNVDSSYVRRLRKDLYDTFCEAGCSNVFIHRRGLQGIQRENISCDLYDWEKGLPCAIYTYRGEYMTQYSWAELRHATLK